MPDKNAEPPFSDLHPLYHVTALIGWSLTLQCEKYLKFYFKLYKASKGSRAVGFDIISVPFD